MVEVFALHACMHAYVTISRALMIRQGDKQCGCCRCHTCAAPHQAGKRSPPSSLTGAVDAQLTRQIVSEGPHLLPAEQQSSRVGQGCPPSPGLCQPSRAAWRGSSTSSRGSVWRAAGGCWPSRRSTEAAPTWRWGGGGVAGAAAGGAWQASPGGHCSPAMLVTLLVALPACRILWRAWI